MTWLVVLMSLVTLQFGAEGPVRVRVMPAGDSLTAIPYYRAELLRMAREAGREIELVGPVQDGSRGGHAAWGGITVGELRERLPAAMDGARPDVVLLMIGTNSMNHGLGLSGPSAKGYPVDVTGRAVAPMYAEPLDGSYLNGLGATWGDRTYGTVYLRDQLAAMFRLILSGHGGPRLIVSTVIPIGRGNPEFVKENDNCLRRIEEFNGLVRAVADELAAEYPGRITVVDPGVGVNRGYGSPPEHDFGAEADQRADWVHPKPDARAWQGIARSFFAALNGRAGAEK